jgi:hypothetical protein
VEGGGGCRGAVVAMRNQPRRGSWTATAADAMADEYLTHLPRPTPPSSMKMVGHGELGRGRACGVPAVTTYEDPTHIAVGHGEDRSGVARPGRARRRAQPRRAPPPPQGGLAAAAVAVRADERQRRGE